MGAHGAGAATLEDVPDRVLSEKSGAEAELVDAYQALAAALPYHGEKYRLIGEWGAEADEDGATDTAAAVVPSGAVYLAQFMAHDLILSDVDD
ncbi:MAG: hypothetical protein AAF416_19575, partial [Pseudomonadota bacterium]